MRIAPIILRGGAIAFLLAPVFLSSPASATPMLGAAGGFAVLGSTVSNTGATTINGDGGVFPGTSFTGTETVTLTGASAYHLVDGVSQQAKADATSAFSALSALSPTGDLTDQVLGTGGTVSRLTPGVYSFASSAQLTGTLTLDFQSLSHAAFVFEIGSALSTASASAINVVNGNSTDSIYFLVGSSATLGTTTSFAGNILASQSIALDTGATILCGRAIALTSAVTLDHNTISNTCDGGGDLGSGRSDFGSNGFSADVASPIPEPSSMLVLSASAFGMAAALRMLRRVDRVRAAAE